MKKIQILSNFMVKQKSPKQNLRLAKAAYVGFGLKAIQIPVSHFFVFLPFYGMLFPSIELTLGVL